MQYSVAHLAYSFAEPWQQDLFEQALCDAGFDAFDGDNAYIPTALLRASRAEVEALILGTEGVRLLSFEDCPEQDWNATWEAGHEVEQLPMDVRITPHCAFGAGHHETTSMMVDALVENKGRFAHVLDMGCGTGVLGIMAAKCGATHVVAVDIDEQSVRNAQENAEQNDVCMDIRQGDTPPAGEYNLILANIHRNILLSQMPDYARYTAKHGEIWLSGFYDTDVPILTDAAVQVGLTPIATRQRGEWRMIQLRK